MSGLSAAGFEGYTSPDPAVHATADELFHQWCDHHDRDIDDPDALEEWHVECELERTEAAIERMEREAWDG